jgi:CheY-like chemotaxis protein
MSLKILLVDDELDTATVFETVLKQGGYEVKVASNGQGALALVKRRFDI